MAGVAEVARAMRTLLTDSADRLAEQTGFVQRRSKPTGAVFARSVVLGGLQQPAASLGQLAQTAAALGVALSPQGLDQRFTATSAEFLPTLLREAVRTVAAAAPTALAILARFTAVAVPDSTPVTPPAALAARWPGGASAAALKLHVRPELGAGGPEGPHLSDGRTHDQRAPLQSLPVPPGALRLSDLGVFDLAVLADPAAGDAFFLTRMPWPTAVPTAAGARVDLLARPRAADGVPLDAPVRLGRAQRLPVRLLAVRVPQGVADQRRRRLQDEARRPGQTVSATRLALADGTVRVTNGPPERLTRAEAPVAARARWRIELLFKLRKQHGHPDRWRSATPWRILRELYAKMLAMALRHWLLLLGCWIRPDRSPVKAAQTIRAQTPTPVNALAGSGSLIAVLDQLRRCTAAGCTLNRRRTKPNTHPLPHDPPTVPVPCPHDLTENLAA